MSGPLPLIPGIGDEVVLVLGTLLLGILILIVWWSTAVDEAQSARRGNPAAAAVVALSLPADQLHELFLESVNGHDLDRTPSNETQGGGGDLSTSIEEPEDPPSIAGGGGEAASTSSAVNNRQEEGEENRQQEEAKDEETSASPMSASYVRIKLKFINESIKEVRAALSEPVGRFKQRHFAADIANNKLIRLIFNGHVLNGDSQTLSQAGLFDNCVVHCLIHQRREQNQNQHQNHQEQQQDETGDLDLSAICYPLLGTLLSVFWWCQMIYGQYFNLTSTISLISLTGLYVISLASFYYY